MRCIVAASSDRALLELIQRALREEYQYFFADTSSGMLDLLAKTAADLIIIDSDLKDVNGIAAVRIVRSAYPEMGIVYIPSGPDDKSAQSARDLDVFGCIFKSSLLDQLGSVAEKAFERKDLLRNIEFLKNRPVVAAGRFSTGAGAVERGDGSDKAIEIVQWEVMRRLSKAITMMHEVDRILVLIVEAITESLNPSNAVVLSWDSQRGAYLPGAWHGIDPVVLKSLTFEKGRGIIKWLQQNSSILYRDDIAGEPAIEQVAEISGDFERLRSVMLIPMLHEGKLVGVLSLGTRFTGAAYRETDIDLLSTVAGYGALAIYNSMQYQKVVRDQASIQSILDNVACGIISVDEHSMITTLNPHAEALLDISASELVGQPVARLRADLADIMKRTLQSKEIFKHHELKDSENERTYSVTTSLIEDPGGAILGAVMFFIDLSDLKKLEDKVHGLERVEFWSNLS